MPESHKIIGYAGFSLGLVFLSYTAVFLYEEITTTKNEFDLYAIYFTLLVVGLVLFLIGTKDIYTDYSRARKSKIAEGIRIKTEILEKASEIKKIINEIRNSGTYLIYPSKKSAISKIENLQREIDDYATRKILELDFTVKMKETLNMYRRIVLNYNKNFIEQRKKDYSYLWNKNNILLDDEQQTAIVTDDKNNLVVAAAGSGKTEVLITRIAYLIKRKPDFIQPNRILALAYQRKAREQIEQRLYERYRIEDVCVRTFHKLGKDILERSGRRINATDIVDENRKYGFVKSYFEEEIVTNREFFRMFIRYITTIHDNNEEPTAMDKNAVLTHAEERSYVSINGTKVKSKAEKEIMDFLLTHKINGTLIRVNYEADVEGFRPDFYLPQYELFIEHWGINKDGEVPTWFNQSSQEYRDLMDKKKRWFIENNRLLLETFAYEYNTNDPEEFTEQLKYRILNTLKNRFPNKKFKFSPLTYEESLNLVWNSQKTPIDDIQHFITTAKTYDLNPDKIKEKLAKGKWNNKQLAFGRLALCVFRAYQSQLEKLGKTDFEDMINDATSALENNESLYENVYDHILIDEYQDISAQRLKLLNKLLERNPNCKLFCVGDDWQSIMSFSGSNLNYFVNFEKYFQNPAITKICTNYRSIKSIVDAGTKVIKNNGKSQVQKEPISNLKQTKPILVLSSQHKAGFDEPYYEQTARDCLRRINEYLAKGYEPNDILVLTRFMRTKIRGRIRFFRIVQTISELSGYCTANIAVDNTKEPNAVKLLTVHKCKGLEAKVVFILNVVKGEFGFPCEIEDPSILEVAREDNGIQSQIEEERRLFYVAITRAKQDLYIYTRQQEKSEFLNELMGHTNELRMNY